MSDTTDPNYRTATALVIKGCSGILAPGIAPAISRRRRSRALPGPAVTRKGDREKFKADTGITIK